MAIKPIYMLLADEQNITDIINNRLLDLTITDNAGWESDTLELLLDDTDHAIVLPDTGAQLKVFLGYSSTEMVFMGTFVVDEIELASVPSTMKITAKAANMSSSLKSPKTTTWEGKNSSRKQRSVMLKTIFEKIALESQLTIDIDDKYKNKSFSILNQRNESDINFLTRLADSVGGVLKITNDTISLKPQVTEQGHINLQPQEVSQWRVNITQRTSYDAVETSYYDKKSAKKVKVTASKKTSNKSNSKNIIKQTKTDAVSAEAAKAFAKAELERSAMGEMQLTLSLPGRMSICAERQLKLSDFRIGVNGTWQIDTVKHQLNNSGYVTEVTASSVPG
ncbi:phage late control D family protein [Zooshikella sp. RANM57]|uniref:phage late control D family protein n=1 Tax=Zooshikella sp. RANM57 TaxID=3425863 RepID=UPI003D6EDA81